MILRSLIRAKAPRIASRRVFRIPSRPIKPARRYSTSSAPSMASSAPQSQASMLATITTDLDKIAPRFDMQPEQITIIQTPTEFYETLNVGFILLVLLSYMILSLYPSIEDRGTLNWECQLHFFLVHVIQYCFQVKPSSILHTVCRTRSQDDVALAHVRAYYRSAT